MSTIASCSRGPVNIAHVALNCSSTRRMLTPSFLSSFCTSCSVSKVTKVHSTDVLRRLAAFFPITAHSRDIGGAAAFLPTTLRSKWCRHTPCPPFAYTSALSTVLGTLLSKAGHLINQSAEHFAEIELTIQHCPRNTAVARFSYSLPLSSPCTLVHFIRLRGRSAKDVQIREARHVELPHRGIPEHKEDHDHLQMQTLPLLLAVLAARLKEAFTATQRQIESQGSFAKLVAGDECGLPPFRGNAERQPFSLSGTSKVCKSQRA